MIELWQRMARYNRLANERLYAACARVPDAERKADRGAFFGSIHATLSHILVGDRIWMARFEGGSAPSMHLDAIPYASFSDLREARMGEDARIERFFAGGDPGFAAGHIEYVNNEGRSFRDPVAVLVPHLWNHQTHHRGQVHALLTRAGADAPVLDLHRVLIPDPATPAL